MQLGRQNQDKHSNLPSRCKRELPNFEESEFGRDRRISLVFSTKLPSVPKCFRPQELRMANLRLQTDNTPDRLPLASSTISECQHSPPSANTLRWKSWRAFGSQLNRRRRP